jgi:hypothetical protein
VLASPLSTVEGSEEAERERRTGATGVSSLAVGLDCNAEKDEENEELSAGGERGGGEDIGAEEEEEPEEEEEEKEEDAVGVSTCRCVA